jgi:DNA (cytosine-5)-methyltransferase 1
VISTVEQLSRNGSRRCGRSECEIVVKPLVSFRVGAVDLCSGLGGLSLAAKGLGIQILAGVDTNSTALRTFSKNFPTAKALVGSVRSKNILVECAALLQPFKTANWSTIVLSGPPCQGFSAAGSRDPADPRNHVLLAVARAISKLQPDCALIENVSMLLAEKHGGHIRKFERTINWGSYHVIHIVIDASDFGVSQKRKRAFFLVTRQPITAQAVMERLEKFKADSIGARKALSGLPKPKVRPDDYDDETSYGVVHNHFAMQHSERVIKKIAAIEPGTGPMSYRRLHPTRLSNTLFSGHRAPPAHFREPRSITVREAARLQGFPDSFRVFGSFANQMEQVTNAVPPPLAQAVLSVLVELANIPVRQHG